MKKKLLVLLALLVFVCSMYGQEDQRITITFDNTPLKEALQQLEDKTPYSFYFEETWLKDRRVTKSYDKKKLRAILNGLFEETDLNYFIKDDRVFRGRKFGRGSTE